MRRRTLIVPPLTLVALLAAVEISARVMDLDQLQHESIAVAAGKSLGETWHQGGAEGWSELLASPEELAELRLLRRCTFAGRPFGEEEFVQAVETKLNRRWRRWGFESKPRVVSATG